MLEYAELPELLKLDDEEQAKDGKKFIPYDIRFHSAT